MPTPAPESFVAFLHALATGGGGPEGWNEFVVQHYPDPRIEEARRDLARASLAAGDWSWPNPPLSLRAAARDLYERVASAAGPSSPSRPGP